jgi:hypothetical protein
MNKTDQLIQGWRELSPADWTESEYGWILPDGNPITLADWQRAVLDACMLIQMYLHWLYQRPRSAVNLY